MSDVESPAQGVVRRAGRASRYAEPAYSPGPADRDAVPDLGLRDGQDLEGVPEEDRWWKGGKRCALCDYREVEGDFGTHLRMVHPADPATLEGEPCERFCRWVCSTCGTVALFPTQGGTHGGPAQRSFDRRFGFHNCRAGKYPDHKRAIGKIDGARGPSVFYHEGLTFSEQPVQDDPSLAEFLPKVKEKKVQKERKQRVESERSVTRARRVG